MADGQESGEQKRQSLTERGRQWFLTIGTVLALLATVIGFLSDSVGVLEFVRNMGASPAATEVVIPLESPTVAPTETVMVVATATAVVTPMPTALPVMAAADERLLLVAQFSNFATDASFNVAGRIHEALAGQVKAAKLEDTRVAVWPETVVDQDAATQVVEETGAALMIWGEYDSGRVRVRFTVAGESAELDWEQLLGAPTELSTTINLDVPRETQALALMTLGRLYRNAGELERARSVFAQALALEPSDTETVATLTFYLAILDAAATPPNLERVIEGYSKVIELRPAWHNARYNRGLAYLTRYWMTAEPTNLDSAIDDFTWTLGVQSKYTEAYVNRGVAYNARNDEGDIDAAIDDFSAAIRFNPKSYLAYYNRGLAYIRLDQQPLWIADLEKALVIAPAYWPSHHALCWGYALDEMPEAGLPHCDEAVSQDASGSTREARGLVLAELGRTDEALDDLEQYIAWLDTQPEAWSELNSRQVYEQVIEGLRAGENPVTPALLEQLR
ncbi:MAG: tetratricopeptide repeat protein [Caldilineaceae bacterium]|nr:tetratricopeptide repeat protein [Caldilineaceae bacterium]